MAKMGLPAFDALLRAAQVHAARAGCVMPSQFAGDRVEEFAPLPANITQYQHNFLADMWGGKYGKPSLEPQQTFSNSLVDQMKKAQADWVRAAFNNRR
jgi:hypothetical protein